MDSEGESMDLEELLAPLEGENPMDGDLLAAEAILELLDERGIHPFDPVSSTRGKASTPPAIPPSFQKIYNNF